MGKRFVAALSNSKPTRTEKHLQKTFQRKHKSLKAFGYCSFYENRSARPSNLHSECPVDFFNENCDF